jgi:hypothetical protein
MIFTHLSFFPFAATSSSISDKVLNTVVLMTINIKETFNDSCGCGLYFRRFEGAHLRIAVHPISRRIFPQSAFFLSMKKEAGCPLEKLATALIHTAPFRTSRIHIITELSEKSEVIIGENMRAT